jgi:hypothetical protein
MSHLPFLFSTYEIAPEVLSNSYALICKDSESEQLRA